MQLPQIFFDGEFREPADVSKLSLDAQDALRVIRLRHAAVKDAEREVVETQADVTAALARVAAEKIAPAYGFFDLWRETIGQ